jgi:hypothetical protein
MVRTIRNFLIVAALRILWVRADREELMKAEALCYECHEPATCRGQNADQALYCDEHCSHDYGYPDLCELIEPEE